MMTNKKTLMRKAIQLSLQSIQKRYGGPFGALIVRKGKIVGKGQNQVTSLNDPTAHAEIQAIRNACKKLKTFELADCEIYSSCEPCPMCLAAIYWARIKKIHYAATKRDAKKIGFDDAYIYQEFSKPLPKRYIKHEQILRDEALKVFEKWKQMEDKIVY